mmetsp:Transcript_30439/g.30918  ORF Transcript_30439/g.30918 Transcript_30439/m.30918 type:complete len:80 (-) Transcript_30439:8-247(-)
MWGQFRLLQHRTAITAATTAVFIAIGVTTTYNNIYYSGRTANQSILHDDGRITPSPPPSPPPPSPPPRPPRTYSDAQEG